MLDGKRPKGCWKCWNEEDSGKKSMRQSVNESRLVPHLDVTNKEHDEIRPLQIKLQAGASCNLACRMCRSHVSSKVHKVWQEIGMDTLEQRRYDDISDGLIRDNAESVRYIDLMGGEPFYHKKVRELVRWLVENGHAEHITIYVTTNAMILDEQLLYDLTKFQNVVAIVSLDAVGKKHEYIRPGADWDTIVTNIERLQSAHINVVIQPVISAINILCLPELIDWCEEHRLHMTQMCLVHDPEPLHPKNLPAALLDKVDSRFKNFVTEAKTESSLDFIKKLDAYWKTKIYHSMPEWKEVYYQDSGNDRLEKDYDVYRRTLAHVKKI
jgi:MoaA/NifB/PqqE/SkfB family radical SAM enzyme